MLEQGLVIVVSAPSGAGKSTICALLEKKLPRLRCSVSFTTRPRRPGEKNGRDYFFIAPEKFKAMIRKKEFVEWARVHDHYYGTPRSFLDKTVRAGNDVALNIDVQGALSIRKLYPRAVMIFVMTPTFAELKRRLVRRRQDSGETIRRRLANARKELRYLPSYDYLVINDRLQTATREIESIIHAEHHKLKNIRKPVFI
ncbi:MAG: guanylate kinase [Elusimicrobia bacterium RIFOXYA2_FULL_50_26]|nr:MAG: guanylate kinase [Elusimicrobia bacterium RIFOXYA2_FULL_50_26]